MVLSRKVNGLIWQVRDLVGAKAIILLYHRIANPEIDPYLLCVSPQHFAEQLAILAEHYTPMSLQQCAVAIEQGRLPGRTAVITFDDGYADNLHVAKPLLERHGFPATLFIATGQTGNPREFWWDELEKIFLLPGTLPQHLEMEISGHTHHWDLETTPSTPRLEVFWAMHKLLRGLPSGTRTEKMDALLKWSGTSREGRPSYRALTTEELASLAKTTLIDLGGHTVTHPNLPEQELTVQREEIRSGKTALEEMIGRTVHSFSYPYGFYSEPTIEFVRQAGYNSACTCSEQPTRNESDPFQLPRLMVRDWDGDEFAKRLDACVHNGQ
jgi:peptidoglycan/xylan/chitin deacetylase (PgdA/CDA1 family)